MKLQKLAGATSEIWQVFIRDSSSTTGAGLTGLTNASGSLTAYYHRDTDTTATAISLVTMTVGTFTSSGFKEIDATNMPGWYQFCPPNAALASGAKSCAFHLKGATNMAPLPIEVQLTAVNPDSATAFMTSVASVTGSVGSVTGLTASNLDTTVSSRMATYTQPTGFLAATFPTTVASTTNITAGTITTATNVTNVSSGGIVASSFASGALDAVWSTAARTLTAWSFQLPSNGLANVTAWTVAITGNITGNLSGSVGSVTGAVGSVTGAVGSVTGNIGGNVTGSVGSVVGLTASNLDTTVSSRMATYTQPTGFLAATFPTTVASPTNITTVAAVSGNVVGSVGSVVGLTASNLDVAVSTRLATAGYTVPDNAGIAAIQGQTDQMIFTGGAVDANITTVDAFPITGDGQPGNEWGPA